MKKFLLLIMMSSCYADVNTAVDNFFNSIQTTTSAELNAPAITHSQSAGVVSLGGVATRSQVVNLAPMTLTPPSFNGSCGNMNFYSGSLSFMTNTDQLVAFLQNTLMTAGITAVMTALKAVTPNIAGTLQSMFDASQKMLNMFNNSCQLGMALGNTSDSWVYDRIAKAKAQAHSDSGDASDAEINSTTGGGSATQLADKMKEVADSYHHWVTQNATMNPADSSAVVNQMANKYGSVIWKGMQALHLYNLPEGDTTDVASIANLVISLTGDIIIYSPSGDGTGIATRTIPPTITDVQQFMTSKSAGMMVYNCTAFNTANPQECNGTTTDLLQIQYPQTAYNGGIMKTIQTAITHIQDHFVNGTALTNDDMFIIAISPVPIFAVAQALDDVGMNSSISNFLSIYSEQISFEILQKLVNISLNLAMQASTARSNNDTQQAIALFTKSITGLQEQINSYAYLYVKKDPVVLVQELNYLKGYAQNQMSPSIMQKVNFAKQLGNY